MKTIEDLEAMIEHNEQRIDSLLRRITELEQRDFKSEPQPEWARQPGGLQIEEQRQY